MHMPGLWRPQQIDLLSSETAAQEVRKATTNENTRCSLKIT